MNGPKPLTNTTDGHRRHIDLAVIKAMRAARPNARAVPAPKPSWVADLPRDLGRKGGRG